MVPEIEEPLKTAGLLKSLESQIDPMRKGFEAYWDIINELL